MIQPAVFHIVLIAVANYHYNGAAIWQGLCNRICGTITFLDSETFAKAETKKQALIIYFTSSKLPAMTKQKWLKCS